MSFQFEDLPPDYIKKAKELNISAEDIIEKFVRGGGKGGQKINKTSICVMLRHIPTRIEVKCQKHREQAKNRISAYKLLIRKIENLKKGKESEEAKRIFKLKKQKKKRSKRAKEKILEEKKRRAELKKTRKNISESHET
jgi:protein subunit release factor B